MRGFYDVDCRELSPSGEWAFRPRVAPIAKRVEAVLALAEREAAPVVATTCGGGQMPKHDKDCLGMVRVPMAPGELSWEGALGPERLFHLEKPCGGWRTFETNGNASRLFAGLGIREWVVFGNGLDLCVDHAVRNLLGLGLSVTFLSDLLVPSALGNGPFGDSGTPASRERTLMGWLELGARETNLEALLKEAP